VSTWQEACGRRSNQPRQRPDPDRSFSQPEPETFSPRQPGDLPERALRFPEMPDEFDLANAFAEAFRPPIDEPGVELERLTLLELADGLSLLNLWHGPKALMPAGVELGLPVLYQEYEVVAYPDEDERPVPPIAYVTSARIISPCRDVGPAEWPEGETSEVVRCSRASGHTGAHRVVSAKGNVLSWVEPRDDLVEQHAEAK
jgi:hypothetical protein